jgi:colanic acid/amylovoran biosynthesis glycosyltransferase
LLLEKMNFEIVPISVHYPLSMAGGNEVADLFKKTYYLYNDSLLSFIFSTIKTSLKHPLRFFSVFIMAVKDSLKTGILSHTGMGLLYRFFVASRLSEIITLRGCSHMHVHFAHISTDIAMYASALSGIPFSFTSHANDLFERGWLLKEKVERSKFAVTISEYNSRFLVGHGAPEDKIHIIHCGVDTESFNRRIEKPSNNIPEIGAIGRMVEKKGFDTLINACEILKKKKQDFHLEIAGTGPLHDDLQNQINIKDLSDKINLIGSLPHMQIPEWLKKKDLFVLPCRRDKHGDMDGIPVVLMEAIAMGVPVISSRISGIPELIEDGISGLLTNEDDSELLSTAITKILTDDKLQDKIIRNALNKVKRDFELSNTTAHLSNLFREAIS